jgi:DNA-binding transcriptional ArsR family regulator
MNASNNAFKAIADPARREILRLLRQGEMTAGDLAGHFDMSKPSMSHHFAVLAEADLITRRRDGQTIWYGLNTTVLQDVLAWVMDLTDTEARPVQKTEQKGRKK